MLPRAWALVPVMLLWTAACAKGANDEPTPNDSPVRVEVTNRNALAVEVYATGHGINHRLGTVHPGMNAQFVIPGNLTTSGSVELQVTRAGSRERFRSGELLLAPGRIVELVVRQQLFNSTATLRP